MLTTDGSTPAFVARHGFLDHLLRLAMAEGVPAVEAYRMVTLHPATYYGRDADLGAIAPGRHADLLLLRDLGDPRPAAVMARGRLVARQGRLLAPVPEPAWGRIFPRRSTGLRLRVAPEDFRLPGGTLPVIRLRSAVITALEERERGPEDLCAALLDRRGGWITTTALSGFAAGLDGLATTLSTDCHVVALGRSPAALARATNRLAAIGGGVVLVDGETVRFELPLPVGGLMAERPLAELARAEEDLQRLLAERGHPFHDPVYTLLFMAADFLPGVRLTARGVWDVRRGRVLRGSRRLGRP
jgi:adenine deaminase